VSQLLSPGRLLPGLLAVAIVGLSPVSRRQLSGLTNDEPSGSVHPCSVYDAVKLASNNPTRASIDQEVCLIYERFGNTWRRGR
jgi:hypothetical protein